MKRVSNDNFGLIVLCSEWRHRQWGGLVFRGYRVRFPTTALSFVAHDLYRARDAVEVLPCKE